MPTTINDRLISWATDIDAGTISQAEKTARLPIVAGHVALMPDAHVGLGATVGSVIPTKGAVIPAAVGVDIGCGMVAAELDVTEAQLPDSLEPLLARIERAIPAGVGKGHDRAAANADRWLATHKPTTSSLTSGCARQPSSSARSVPGTTSSRCASTSRPGVGGAPLGQPRHRQPAGTRPTSPPRGAWRRMELRLEDPDLAYFVEGTTEFDAYIGDMLWAQDYARPTVTR